MRETQVPLESVWERLVRAVEEGSKRPSKSLKGSKLRRTSNLTFSKTGLKLHTKKQWLRLSLRTIEYATNTYKKYFYTFTINKIIFTNGERKKERPNFFGMFSQNLPISTAFIAILEIELPQYNAIGVRTPPDPKRSNTDMQWKLTSQCVSRRQEEASFPKGWNRILFRVSNSFPCFLVVLRENERSHKGRILKQTQRREQRRELFMTCADYIVLSET